MLCQDAQAAWQHTDGPLVSRVSFPEEVGSSGDCGIDWVSADEGIWGRGKERGSQVLFQEEEVVVFAVTGTSQVRCPAQGLVHTVGTEKALALYTLTLILLSEFLTAL